MPTQMHFRVYSTLRICKFTRIHSNSFGMLEKGVGQLEKLEQDIKSATTVIELETEECLKLEFFRSY